MTTDPGGGINLSWGESCQVTDADYAVYEGELGTYPSHAPLLCSTVGATSTTVVPNYGAAYYLVVPVTSNREGSYGVDSTGAQRPAGSIACLPQAIAACP